MVAALMRPAAALRIEADVNVGGRGDDAFGAGCAQEFGCRLMVVSTSTLHRRLCIPESAWRVQVHAFSLSRDRSSGSYKYSLAFTTSQPCLVTGSGRTVSHIKPSGLHSCTHLRDPQQLLPVRRAAERGLRCGRQPRSARPRTAALPGLTERLGHHGVSSWISAPAATQAAKRAQIALPRRGAMCLPCLVCNGAGQWPHASAAGGRAADPL